jgi:hypothetical protein
LITEDQGEVAIVIQKNKDGQYEIVAYSTPVDGPSFETMEVRDLFLAASLDSRDYSKRDARVLDSYLTEVAGSCNFRYKASLYQETTCKGVKLRHSEKENKEYVDQLLQRLSMESQTVPTLHSSKGPDSGIFANCACGNLANHPWDGERSQFVGKKYKPVAVKVKPILDSLPDKFRIKREIIGDPLADMPKLDPNPPEFTPTGRYTEERKKQMDQNHEEGFLLPEERKLLHYLVCLQNLAFAWDDTEKGKFKKEFFADIEIPVIAHTPWVLRPIPIPPGIYAEVCKIIKTKLDAGTYEPSNSSYRSRWFCVIKKDGKSLRIVHSLEPLNAVTIAHSGLPPATEELAEQFASRACGGILDLYVGYDERDLHPDSRDLTTFQTPFGVLRLVTLPMGWTNSVPIFP